jgi:hypothetical protein
VCSWLWCLYLCGDMVGRYWCAVGSGVCTCFLSNCSEVSVCLYFVKHSGNSIKSVGI